MRALIVAAIVTVVFLPGPTPAEASCVYSAPLRHNSSYFDWADFKPVADLAYQADDPTGATTSTVDIACEQASGWINPSAGVMGDGVVIIGFDWAYPGRVGCPGDLGPGGPGRTPATTSRSRASRPWAPQRTCMS